MKVVSVSSKEIVMRPSVRGDENMHSFVFDIGIVPDKPTPKRLMIRRQNGRVVSSWSMTWRKFMRQHCVDVIAIIPKSEFVFERSIARKRG